MTIDEIKKRSEVNAMDYELYVYEDIKTLLSTLKEKEEEIKGLKERLEVAENDCEVKAEEIVRVKSEVSRLNALLKEARECYEKWKDKEFIFAPTNRSFVRQSAPTRLENIRNSTLMGTSVYDMWQVIKKIGEA
jgi:chromosome segregation ATPase